MSHTLVPLSCYRLFQFSPCLVLLFCSNSPPHSPTHTVDVCASRSRRVLFYCFVPIHLPTPPSILWTYVPPGDVPHSSTLVLLPALPVLMPCSAVLFQFTSPLPHPYCGRMCLPVMFHTLVPLSCYRLFQFSPCLVLLFCSNSPPHSPTHTVDVCASR
ncbi:hypothetical protein J6590_006799 [Homalodisca vitripennis]|nr:hypothetical protein J6590_006799 [Homalodisca vitripennis]